MLFKWSIERTGEKGYTVTVLGSRTGIDLSEDVGFDRLGEVGDCVVVVYE
jgi:hypothetical protein